MATGVKRVRPRSVAKSPQAAHDRPRQDDELARRVRLAELASSLGAGILGLGIGVRAASYLSGLGLLIVGVGLFLHAWGMADRQRMEARPGAPRIWWSTLMYWLCWISLVGLAAFVVWRRF